MIFYKNQQGERKLIENWQDINEPIYQLIQPLNDKLELVMEGFGFYMRVIEEVQGVTKSFKTITKIILYGQFLNQVAMVVFDIKSHQYYRDCVPIFQAYNKKPLNPNLWKQGVSSTPRIYEVDIQDRTILR